jgi:hypothetical protein
MNPAIFKPMQKRKDGNSNYFGSLTTLGSTIEKRQQEVDAILEALAENNPEDAAAVKQSLGKRQEDMSDEAAALLAAETPVQKDTEASKASLDADVLAANGLNSDFTKSESGNSGTSQAQSDTTPEATDSQAGTDTTTEATDSQAGTDTTTEATDSQAGTDTTTEATDSQPETDTTGTEAQSDSTAADSEATGTESTSSQSDSTTEEEDGEEMEKRQIKEAHEALVKFAAVDPDAAQFVKAFVTPVVKRQGKLPCVQRMPQLQPFFSNIT